MQALRNSIYLIVAVGSIALAACQPPDRFTETPGPDIGSLAALSHSELTGGAVSTRSPDVVQPQTPQ